MNFKISKFFLYTSVFAVAIVSTSTLFPFIVGKYSWFRASVDLSLIFFLIGLLQESVSESQHYIDRFKKVICSPIAIAVSGFVLMFLLACVFGVDPHQSFWSNFERGEGGLQIIHLYTLFLLLATLFSEERQWLKIFYCSMSAAVLVIGYGVLTGLKVSGFIGAPFTDVGYRMSGSIGNPAYVAVYLLFIIFYTFYVLFTKYRENLKSAGAIALYGLLAIFLGGFLAAATRGAVLGFLAAVFIFLIYLAIFGKKFRKTIFSLAALVVLLFGAGVVFKNSPSIQKLPFARIFDISVSTKTFSDRTDIWKMAWDGFKERPILGYGPENFLSVFDRHFNTAYFQPPQPFGAWFDRAHSVIFDYLVETGIMGFAGYASIFLVFYMLAAKNSLKRRGLEKNGADIDSRAENRFASLSLPARAIVFVLPLAYLIQGLVLFDILPTYINLFLFFAFTYYLFAKHQVYEKRA